MNIKNPCKKVELRARFVVVTTKLVPDSPYQRLIAEYLSFQTAVGGLEKMTEPTVGVGGCIKGHRQKHFPVIVILFLNRILTCDCMCM